MTLGVLTENGVQVTSAPVISDDSSTSFFLFKQSKMNKQMKELAKDTIKLKMID
jgi:hypothetical protein